MKKTKKAWLLFAMQIVFMLVVPCVLVWLQYGGAELGQKYKISLTAVILIIAVFSVFKRIVVAPWLKKIDGQLSQIEIQQLSVTDPAAIKSNKKRYRRLAVTQLIFSLILPALMFALALMTLKVVEAQIIKLYGVLMLCGISIGLGVLCRLGEIYALRCEHEK